MMPLADVFLFVLPVSGLFNAAEDSMSIELPGGENLKPAVCIQLISVCQLIVEKSDVDRPA